MLARYALLIASMTIATAVPLAAEEARETRVPEQNSTLAIGTSAAPAPSLAPRPTPPTVERVQDATLAPAAAEPSASMLAPPAPALPAVIASPPPREPAIPSVPPSASVPMPLQPAASAASAAPPPPADSAPASPPASADATPPSVDRAVDPSVVARATVASAIAEILKGPALAGISVDNADRDAMRAFYAARAHDPMWTADGTSLSPRGELVLATVRAADDWGLTGSALAPPTTPVATTPVALARAEIELTLAALGYVRQARGGRIPDPVRQLSRNLDRKPPLLEPSTVLAALADHTDPRGYLEGLHPRHPQFERLRQKWLTARAGRTIAAAEEPAPDEPSAQGKRGRQPTAKATGAKATGAKATKKASGTKAGALAEKLLVNMEQWRWMPEDLGTFHVWSNIPEYTVRVMRHGKAVHTEKIIIGKPNTQTPVFSNAMNQVVFHPFWGVPDSIKRNEILPSLAKGASVLARNNLRISYKGREVDPGSVDWSKTDIRNLHVYQPPGAGNVLGIVKFLFPNHHQVYMHDTPTKNLFASAAPMYSHGCMRVRDPLKLAELLLAEDKGWNRARVDAAVASKRQDQQITLDTKFPVHVTYFTAWVDDDGKLRTMADVYGHERRIALGIAGRFREIPPTPTSTPAEPIGRLVEAKQTPAVTDWARAAFGQP